MNLATVKNWYRLQTTRKNGTVGTRRKSDWVQFAALLVSILTLIVQNAARAGKLAQQLEDLARQEQLMENRLAHIEEQWLRFQATRK